MEQIVVSGPWTLFNLDFLFLLRGLNHWPTLTLLVDYRKGPMGSSFAHLSRRLWSSIGVVTKNILGQSLGAKAKSVRVTQMEGEQVRSKEEPLAHSLVPGSQNLPLCWL